MKSWGNQLPHMRILIQVHTAEYRWPCHWFTCLLQCESIEHWCLMCDPLNFRFLWTCSPSLLSHHLFWNGGVNQMPGGHIPAVSTILDLIPTLYIILLNSDFIFGTWTSSFVTIATEEFIQYGEWTWIFEVHSGKKFWIHTIIKAHVCKLINKVMFTSVSYVGHLTS
jgi:hypothetical protein